MLKERPPWRYGNPPVAAARMDLTVHKIKLEAAFFSSAHNATFRPNVGVKGLQQEMWLTGHDFAVIATDETKKYSAIGNFPEKKEDFEQFHQTTAATTREYGKHKIVVNFNVVSSVKFETLKVGRLMNYLTKNNIWLQEREFDTPEVVCVGCMTLRRHDLVHRESMTLRIRQTMQAYIQLTDITTLSKEHQIALMDCFKDVQSIPNFALTKRTKKVKNPKYEKNLQERNTHTHTGKQSTSKFWRSAHQ
jgi:hypothetical protein